MSRTGGRGEVYRIYKVNSINFVHFSLKLALSSILKGKNGPKGAAGAWLLQAAGALAVLLGAYVLAAAEYLGKIA